MPRKKLPIKQIDESLTNSTIHQLASEQAIKLFNSHFQTLTSFSEFKNSNKYFSDEFINLIELYYKKIFN